MGHLIQEVTRAKQSLQSLLTSAGKHSRLLPAVKDLHNTSSAGL